MPLPPSLDLLQELVSAYGPAGQEDPIRMAVQRHVDALGYESTVDAKGNLRVGLGGRPRIIVTAHLDEIALMVQRVRWDGRLLVRPLGGIHAWKLGEGPVDILAETTLPGVIGFGSIHTEDASSPAVQARDKTPDWRAATVFTGLSLDDLLLAGVRPGTRVVVSQSRRTLTRLHHHVAGHFLDDRADLVAWLLALDSLKEFDGDVMFAATTAEEVGCEGAQYLMGELRPEVCIALELGPNTPDAPVLLTADPTVWAIDGYAAMQASDLDLVALTAAEIGLQAQFQALSRGGSDATVAATRGLCARPITLGLAIDNSHGYEVMHVEAMEALGRLTSSLVRKLTRKA